VTAGVVEIVGLFLVIVGCGTIVAAAAMVSTALAVLTAGGFIVLAGVLAVFVALQLERAPKPKQGDLR
jgi:hypothetical protein